MKRKGCRIELRESPAEGEVKLQNSPMITSADPTERPGAKMLLQLCPTLDWNDWVCMDQSLDVDLPGKGVTLDEAAFCS